MPRRPPPDKPIAQANRDGYLVKSLVHASEILWVFQHPGEGLRLRDVMDRTGFGKGMCFRLLYTLRHCGFIEKVDGNRYRLTSEIRRRKRYRIGYASQGQDSSFGHEVQRGLVTAAERERVELIVVDNRYQPKIALKNARAADPRGRRSGDRVPDRRVGGAGDCGEVSRSEDSAHRHRHPASRRDLFRRQQLRGGAAGRPVSRAMGAAALERPRRRDSAGGAGPCRIAARVAHSRRRRRHPRGDSRSGELAGGVDRRRRAVQDRARAGAASTCGSRAPSASWSAAANDPSALGAARAFEEAGRADDCAIAGQNAEPDARAELRRRARR